MKVLLLVTCVAFGVDAAPPGNTFGIAHKATWLDPSDPRPPGTWAGKPWPSHTEVQVFNHTCTCNAKVICGCAMQHCWTGGDWPGYELSRIRYYVDGEISASVNIPLGLGHGQPYNDDDGPWSAGVAFGKTGQPSGTFNNFAIPFQKSIKITVELLGPSPSNAFWIIVRGRTIHTDSSTSGVAIPGTSTWDMPLNARLRTIERSSQKMAPGSFHTLWHSNASYIAVYMVVLQVEATGNTFLEGCMRVLDSAGDLKMLLSSGTEDYFGGTYYFNKSKYQTGVAGLTHGCPLMANNCSENLTRFSAYRLHSDDPVFVEGAGHSQTWRNGDASGCQMDWDGRGAPLVYMATSFTMVYEWGDTESTSIATQVATI